MHTRSVGWVNHVCIITIFYFFTIIFHDILTKHLWDFMTVRNCSLCCFIWRRVVGNQARGDKHTFSLIGIIIAVTRCISSVFTMNFYITFADIDCSRVNNIFFVVIIIISVLIKSLINYNYIVLISIVSPRRCFAKFPIIIISLI